MPAMILLESVGIFSAQQCGFVLCADRKVRTGLETTWAVAGLFSWILLPIGVSLILLPDFTSFYASMGSPLLLNVPVRRHVGVGNVSYA